MDWTALKVMVADGSGLGRDALHLLTGCGAHVLLVVVFRSWFGALWPLGLILLAELGNEWSDLMLDPWPGEARAQQWWESVKDVLTTLAFPVLLVVLARFAASRFRRPEPVAELSDEMPAETLP